MAFLGARAETRPASRSRDCPDLDAVERNAISTAIAKRQGNLTRIAKELRISKSTLYLKIDKYGLNTTLRQARHHDR
jgi:transcriptional regulator with PAS, ATPase and Fis domain